MSQTKVLVVDDDSSTFDLIRRQTSEALIEAQCVLNEEEALQFLKRWQPDLVLVDGQLAKQNDFALLTALSEQQRQGVPAVAISSAPSDGSQVEFRLRFNIQFFLQKPLAPETLEKTLLDFAGAAPAGEHIDLRLDPARSRKNVLDVDDEADDDIEKQTEEQLSQSLKDAVGVFSTSKPVVLGQGATTRKIRVKEYWYVAGNGEELTAQSVNSVHIPSGEKFQISKKELLSKYDPEMDYMYKRLLPALRNLESTLAKGDRHRSRMEHFSAEMEYNEALRIDDENVRATFGLGLTYLELQDAKKADAVFKSLINLDAAFDEEHKHLFNEFGIQLRKNKMFDHAVQYYDRARELSKEDEHIFFNLARAWYEKGDWANCLRNLIICLTMNKDLEEAQRFCKHVLVLALDEDLCKTLNKAPLQLVPGSPYTTMLWELREAAGISNDEWEELQAEVTAEKKKQIKAAAKNDPFMENAASKTSKKKNSDPAENGASGKYLMPF